MPEFILSVGDYPAFNALDGFTRGYIEALFFTDEEQLAEEGNRETPDVVINMATMESSFVGGDSFGFSDLAPSTLAAITADCAAFQLTNAALLSEAYARDYDDAQAGRDFWYTRNGHGVGFWDRSELDNDSEELSAIYAEMRAEGTTPAEWSALFDKAKALTGNLGERLSTAARACRNVDSYVGDDGAVYLS